MFYRTFDRSALLERSPIWSRGIIWGIMGVTTAVLIWASIAQIEEAIPAAGKLEPTGAVKEVQAPVGGVVKTVHVQEGTHVKAGELLVSLVPTATQSQLNSLKDIRRSLLLENQYYRSQMGKNSAGDISLEIAQLNLKPELISLTKSRKALVAENELYRVQLQGNGIGGNLSQAAQERQQAAEAEFNSRLAAAELEVDQLKKQLQSNQIEIAGTKDFFHLAQAKLKDLEKSSKLKVAQLQKESQQNQLRLTGVKNLLLSLQSQVEELQTSGKLEVAQLQKQAAQNRIKRANLAERLSINQGILQNLEPVVQAGAISRVQFLRQQQEVISLKSEIGQLDEEYARLQLQQDEVATKTRNEIQKKQQEIILRQAEAEQLKAELERLEIEKSEGQSIAENEQKKQQQEIGNSQTRSQQLQQENQRLQLAIAQAQERAINTTAVNRKDLHTLTAENEKKIAEIDSQLTKALVENDKKIAEIDSQISQAQLNLAYQELRSPVAGKVFDLKVKAAGFVAKPGEAILKIVPEDQLIAQVAIINKDIGFVKPGMPVDVRIDSFPFSEFGDVKGTLESIGSDALEPDQVHPFYRFPAKVRLQEQFLTVRGENVPLQSGMSVSVNIKVRNRSVLSLFTDLFAQPTESLKRVRRSG
jgi:HlyD family secretion protein